MSLSELSSRHSRGPYTNPQLSVQRCSIRRYSRPGGGIGGLVSHFLNHFGSIPQYDWHAADGTDGNNQGQKTSGINRNAENSEQLVVVRNCSSSSSKSRSKSRRRRRKQSRSRVSCYCSYHYHYHHHDDY